MTDNTTLDPGSGGDNVRTIDRAGTKTQVMQLDVGGVAGESLVSADNPLPVDMNTVVYLLAAILDKLPRIDANDRLIVNPSEVAPATTPITGAVSVTTVNSVAALHGFGTSLRPADAMPMHLANAGANYLYDRITF